MAEDVHIHDWTRVDAGTWHSFHQSWLAEFKRSLNRGGLPDGYYADTEKPESGYIPDVLTFEAAQAGNSNFGDGFGSGDADEGDVATLAPPKTSLTLTSEEADWYAGRRRAVGVRSETDDRLVALLELASPANKDRRSSVEKFAQKVEDSVTSGVHVSVIDLFPPRRADGPGGLVGACAEALGFDGFEPVADKPLWTGSLEAGWKRHLYAEPLAVGDALPDLPIFLRPGFWVPVPLASTYAAAWEATPKRWRKVIEGAEPATS